MHDRLKLFDSAQEMLICELDKITKNDSITPSQLDILDKLVDIIKDFDEIIMNEESREYDSQDGYSQRSMPRYYYMRGNSYRDGGMGYSRRNDMMPDGMERGRSRGSKKDDMVEYLYLALDNASSDDEHKRIKRMIDEIENAK